MKFLWARILPHANNQISRRVTKKFLRREKNLDFIVANDVTAEGAGFSVPTNIASIIWRDGNVESFPKMKKSALAEKIIERVANLLGDRKFSSVNDA